MKSDVHENMRLRVAQNPPQPSLMSLTYSSIDKRCTGTCQKCQYGFVRERMSNYCSLEVLASIIHSQKPHCVFPQRQRDI